jgi:hypothetical protein
MPFNSSAGMRDSTISRRVVSFATIGLVVAGLSSCSEPTVAGGAPLALSFSASNPTSSQSLAAVAAPGDILITVGAHTLDLQQVRLTIDRAELERNDNVTCLNGDDDDYDADHDRSGPGDGDDNECEDVTVGPATFDLPLGGGVVTLDQTAVPAGTYREIAIRFSEVRFRGLFDGQAFDVMMPVRLEHGIEFSPPLVVTEGTPAEITVNTAVATWLVNIDGSLIDPRSLATNATLQAIVRSRIAGSFHAFEDHDRDGHDDRSGHG